MPLPDIQHQVNIWFPGLPMPLLIFFLVAFGLVGLGIIYAFLRTFWILISVMFGSGCRTHRSYTPTGLARPRMSYRNNWANNPNNPANINSPLNPNSPMNIAHRHAQQAQQQAMRHAQQHAHRHAQQAQQQAMRQAHRAQQVHRQAHQQAIRHASPPMHRHKF